MAASSSKGLVSRSIKEMIALDDNHFFYGGRWAQAADTIGLPPIHHILLHPNFRHVVPSLFPAGRAMARKQLARA